MGDEVEDVDDATEVVMAVISSAICIEAENKTKTHESPGKAH